MENWKIIGANLAVLSGLLLAVAAIVAYKKYRYEFLAKGFVIIAIANVTVGLSIHLEKLQAAQDISVEYNNRKEEQKISSKRVGKVLNGRHSDSGNSLFSRAFTTVETDQGVYKVSGTQMLTKGQELEIQLRASGSEYLCIPENNANCMRLIN